MGMATILVMWTGPFEQTSVPQSYGVSIWNLSSIGPVISEEKMFEKMKMLTNDGRQSHWHTNSSPRSLRLRWAKKVHKFLITHSFQRPFYKKLVTGPGFDFVMSLLQSIENRCSNMHMCLIWLFMLSKNKYDDF